MKLLSALPAVSAAPVGQHGPARESSEQKAFPAQREGLETNGRRHLLSAKVGPAPGRGGYPGSPGGAVRETHRQAHSCGTAPDSRSSVTGFPWVAFASGQKATSARGMECEGSIARQARHVKQRRPPMLERACGAPYADCRVGLQAKGGIQASDGEKDGASLEPGNSQQIPGSSLESSDGSFQATDGPSGTLAATLLGSASMGGPRYAQPNAFRGLRRIALPSGPEAQSYVQ